MNRFKASLSHQSPSPSAKANGHQHGLTLLELLVTLAIASMLMAGLAGVVGSTLQLQSSSQMRNDLTRQARFAMQRMVSAVQESPRLLLPLADNPNTNWSEHIRVQTVPASTPEGSSTLATAVLAVTLSPNLDIDQDGWGDANNDQDYLDLNNNSSRDSGEPERIDEDLGRDNSNDGAPGIIGIDDNGDGSIDDSDATNPNFDNDEDDANTEDSINGIDDDNDGSIDEDIRGDMNDDSASGQLGIDDDYDTSIDESATKDDDEDGTQDEDWLDPVVFYLSGNQLIERLPSLTDTNNDSIITGADYTESVVADGVVLLRIERIPQNRALLIDITLTLADASGEQFSLSRQLRLGGAL